MSAIRAVAIGDHETSEEPPAPPVQLRARGSGCLQNGSALFAIGEEGTERALLQGDVRSEYPTRAWKEYDYG